MKLLKKDSRAEAVEAALLKNYNKYYRLAYSYVHNDADAADIVQNGAYKAILNCDSLRKEQYAGTWLYRIMLNETFQFLKERNTVSIDEVDYDMGREDAYMDIDLRRALDSMSEEDKAVIELKYFEELQFQEIAEILDENISTVKSRLYRGLQKLRLELADI